MIGGWATRFALGLALCLVLGACSEKPWIANPAIWRVIGPDQQEGWLFGTIHAAPRPLAWKTPKVEAALARSGELLVEVAGIADDAAVAQAFTALSRTAGLPPAIMRMAPAQRPALQRMLADRRIDASDLHDVETWAIALTLARPATGSDAVHGIDRAVLAAAKGKRVIELEGASAQLSIFDCLPEAEQRDLLNAVVADAGALDHGGTLVDAWRKGDMARIEAETRIGLLADPELRAALFTQRNRRWAHRIAAEIRADRKPFVAVGAAHMVGPDGLVAMLGRAGFTVERLR